MYSLSLQGTRKRKYNGLQKGQWIAFNSTFLFLMFPVKFSRLFLTVTRNFLIKVKLQFVYVEGVRMASAISWFKKQVIVSYPVSIKHSHLIIFIPFPKFSFEMRFVVAFAVFFCSHLQVSFHQWSLLTDRVFCYFISP